jgi:hypothetical protein
MNMWLRTGCSLALIGLVAGCSPAPPSDEALASSVIITKHAPDAKFSAYRTYFLRPEIRQFTSDGTLTPIDPQYATPLLDETKKQMAARGFQLVENKADAELAMEMVYSATAWTATSCYSWWDPYYWGYPGWYYYPYYGCSYSTWQTNTLTTTIVDLTPARATGASPMAAVRVDDGGVGVLGSLWFSAIYGIMFSEATSVQRGLDGIDQAFVQSPYLINH